MVGSGGRDRAGGVIVGIAPATVSETRPLGRGLEISAPLLSPALLTLVGSLTKLAGE